MTEEQLKHLQKLSSKDETVKELLSEWRKYSESPHKDSYLTLLNQINDWNAQLEIKEEEVNIEGVPTKKITGRVDLFSDKDSKEFDRVFKYFAEITTMLQSLDIIRGKMNPEQQEEVEKESKKSKNTSIAV